MNKNLITRFNLYTFYRILSKTCSIVFEVYADNINNAKISAVNNKINKYDFITETKMIE